MPCALSLSQVTVRYSAGIDGCQAFVTVFAGIDLNVRCGEVVGIYGDRDAGKSTLLLCAAGLLRPTSGEIRWFERAGFGGPRDSVVYVRAGVDSLRRTLELPLSNGPQLILLDDPFCDIGGPEYARLATWIEQARRRGDAVLITARDRSPLKPLDARIAVLRGGKLSADPLALSGVLPARVAERAEFG